MTFSYQYKKPKPKSGNVELEKKKEVYRIVFCFSARCCQGVNNPEPHESKISFEYSSFFIENSQLSSLLKLRS